MRTLLLTLILLFTIYIFHGCAICTCKKVSCPAFDDVNFLNWFSYQQSQVIFKYQSAYDTINLLPFEKSEAYEASQGCYNGSDGCSQRLSIVSNEVTANFRQEFSVTYFSQTVFGSSASTKSITLFLQGFTCSASDINDQGLVLPPGLYSSNYSPSLPINGTTFNNVQTITRDTTADISPQQPYKVFLSKGVGLIAYETYPTRALWVKQ
jgi:hypothetical protein